MQVARFVTPWWREGDKRGNKMYLTQPEDLQTTSNVGRRRWQRVRRARAAGGKEIWSEWTQTAGYVG